jgi:hypothetical protein
MQSVTEFFKEENDFLYRKGFEKGFKRGFESTEYGSWVVNVIKNIIAQSDFIGGDCRHCRCARKPR